MKDKFPAAAETDDDDLPRVIIVRDIPVMLDASVAAAFEVETREVNQAVSRNLEKFTEKHCFRLTAEEAAALRSQGVIPKRVGRGGSNVPPMAYTQKGVARLATVLSAPKALAATDLMIDIFTEIYSQLAAGNPAPTLKNSSRLVPQAGLAEKVQRLKISLIDHLDALMNTPIKVLGGVTVKDELSEKGNLLLADIKAMLERRTLQNDKLVADTMLVLEEVQTMRQKRSDDAARAAVEHERLHLENIRTRIGIVKETLTLLEHVEPSVIATLYQGFAPGQPALEIGVIEPPDATEP